MQNEHGDTTSFDFGECDYKICEDNPKKLIVCEKDIFDNIHYGEFVNSSLNNFDGTFINDEKPVDLKIINVSAEFVFGCLDDNAEPITNTINCWAVD